MWVFDAVHRDGISLWVKGKKKGAGVSCTNHPFIPSFSFTLPEDRESSNLIAGLEDHFSIEETKIKTINESFSGYRIEAPRQVADIIEKETNYQSKLYNVDIRGEQRFFAERNTVPCCSDINERFSVTTDFPLSVITLKIPQSFFDKKPINKLFFKQNETEAGDITGTEPEVLSSLFALIGELNPDVILMPSADLWLPEILNRAKRYDLEDSFSRNGKYRRIMGHSYWSYGKVEYRGAAYVPDGRIVIDTAQSFTYREGGLPGVLLCSRLAGLSPNYVSRFTPGTLISGYEVYEAVRRGLAIPYRKDEPEKERLYCDIRTSDRGGMMFKPVANIYENVYQIDFTSMYPSIIVNYNLSPETLTKPGIKGFLPQVLEPVLNLRKETKLRKKEDPSVSGIDSILKWLLVVCFGYTGFKNAKFGHIGVHEAITRHSRDILIHSKEIAEVEGFLIIHGIVDCLWVKGKPVSLLKKRIEEYAKIPTEIEEYNWIVFLPQKDGTGSYTRYFGRLTSSEIKKRGVLSRRNDTPDYVRNAQNDLFEAMRSAVSINELFYLSPVLREIYEKKREEVYSQSHENLLITRKVSTIKYRHRCAEASAIAKYNDHGIFIKPGMEIQYIVSDHKKWEVEIDIGEGEPDYEFYKKILDKAWEEIDFALRKAGLNENMGE